MRAFREGGYLERITAERRERNSVSLTTYAQPTDRDRNDASTLSSQRLSAHLPRIEGDFGNSSQSLPTLYAQ